MFPATNHGTWRSQRSALTREAVADLMLGTSGYLLLGHLRSAALTEHGRRHRTGGSTSHDEPSACGHSS